MLKKYVLGIIVGLFISGCFNYVYCAEIFSGSVDDGVGFNPDSVYNSMSLNTDNLIACLLAGRCDIKLRTVQEFFIDNGNFLSYSIY